MSDDDDSRQIRRPLSIAERERLEALLVKVPTVTTVRHVWETEEGKAFLHAVRRLQLAGVPARWIATDLGLSYGVIGGALGTYYHHGKRALSRRRRTVRDKKKGSTDER